ncbi:MAG: preprotein translocase subunit SecY [Deltaproteobacteria bacterium]|nr:preprotein translocase subunit SecY [Deltaproteobacteria bacterium]
MVAGFQNLPRVPELRRRIGFTLVMLAVYRLGVAVPTPGIDGDALSEYFRQASGTVFGMVNLFSGGALERFSIFALGIMPYISASIILQLMTMVVPYLERLSKEGEQGRRRITQYTRYGTVALALIQGFFISLGLEQIQAPGGGSIVYDGGWSFRLMTMITLSSGTVFIMWLGEQITERGIGNGISLIIFSGIVSSIPSAVTTVVEFVRQGELGVLVLALLSVVMVATVGAIIFVERGQRRIPVQYAKRVVGRRLMSAQATHLPLKINMAGVIPPIFASSLLIFPSTIAQFIQVPAFQQVAGMLAPGGLVYNLVYIAAIIFFAYFYTAVTFDPNNVAENLQKAGGFVPGIRPGKRTADYLDHILTRLTLGGAVYVAAICVLPTILIAQFNVPFFFGGTALLIVVGVAIDTVAQMQAHLIQRSYEGFLKKGKLRGRR